MGISVVINTYNASKHLVEVLESVKKFDEIVICDMQSTDDTLDIAGRYGCKVVAFEKKDYNIVEPARNFAISAAGNEWVLVVDADEIITTELREYLYDRIKYDDCPDGFFIPRKNYTMNSFMKSSYPDYQLRFFRRDKIFWPPVIHSVPKIDGIVEKIPAERMELAFIHLSDTVQGWLKRLMAYTDNEVERRKGYHVTYSKLVFAPFFRFFKAYFMKGGCRFGRIGFIQAYRGAVYKFVVLCKLLEKELEAERKKTN